MEKLKREEMTSQSFKQWETFNQKKENYPKWPNEIMLKLVFGNYLKNKIQLSPGSRVLDVGCGFGNNLLPFLESDHHCFGTEVTSEMAKQTQEILENRGFQTDIREGTNKKIPFENDFFDLLLSINVIHYEKSEDEILKGLQEYCRVTKNGGRIILMTVGPEHTIKKRAKSIGAHRYVIQNFDFRDGETFFYFDDMKHLQEILSKIFVNVEAGRVTEKLMQCPLDFLVGAGEINKEKRSKNIKY